MSPTLTSPHQPLPVFSAPAKNPQPQSAGKRSKLGSICEVHLQTVGTQWFPRKSLGSSKEGKCEIVRDKGRKLGGWEDGSVCKTLATGMPGFSSQHCVKAACGNRAYDPSIGEATGRILRDH